MPPDPTLALLDALERVYRDANLPCDRVPASDTIPTPQCHARLSHLGRGEALVTIATSILELPSPADGDRLGLAQTMAVFDLDVPASRGAALDRCMSALNPHLPLGAFARLPAERTLFLRQSTVVNLSRPPGENVSHIDREIGLMLHTLSSYMDVLRDVARGTDPAEALRSAPHAELFAASFATDDGA
jgi:hypothetical protein